MQTWQNERQKTKNNVKWVNDTKNPIIDHLTGVTSINQPNITVITAVQHNA